MRLHSATLILAATAAAAACTTGGGAAAPGNGGSGGSAAGTGGAGGSPGGTGGSAPPGAGPTLAGCPVFPADNEWNRDISADPVDPNSDAYLATTGAATRRLHPDFGANRSYGIPWIAVPGTQPRLPISFTYDDESDPGPYPFPLDAPIEGGPGATGDRHVIVLERDGCRLYEGFACAVTGNAWRCDSGAVFDLRSNRARPAGWTSADAAGLAILPGLVKRSEVMAGEIKHALRFTVARTQRAYVPPASHYASSNTDPNLPPMGLRVRLKASFDIARFSAPVRTILTAMKRYGMILADNGSDWFFSGEMNTQWNDDELAPLKTIPASAFEVVKHGPIVRP